MAKKLYLYLFLLMTCSFAAHAAPEIIQSPTMNLPKMQNPVVNASDEVHLLDNLIRVTKKNLDQQMQLKDLLVEYLQIKDQYMQNTDDKQLSYRMVQKAYALFSKIKEDYLIQLFDKEFMSELTFFAGIGAKWNNPND